MEEEMEVEDHVKEVEKVLQTSAYSHAWLDLYPCSIYSSLKEYGLYSNRLGPYEFLRVQAKLTTKSIDRVQEMCRKIEKRSIERIKTLDGIMPLDEALKISLIKNLGKDDIRVILGELRLEVDEKNRYFVQTKKLVA